MTTDRIGDEMTSIDDRVRAAATALTVADADTTSVAAAAKRATVRHHRQRVVVLAATGLLVIGGLAMTTALRTRREGSANSAAGGRVVEGFLLAPGNADSPPAEENPDTVPNGWVENPYSVRFDYPLGAEQQVLGLVIPGRRGNNARPLGVCEAGYRATVVETDRTVEITVHEYVGGDVRFAFCTLTLGPPRRLDVKLARPLGDRKVIDAGYPPLEPAPSLDPPPTGVPPTTAAPGPRSNSQSAMPSTPALPSTSVSPGRDAEHSSELFRRLVGSWRLVSVTSAIDGPLTLPPDSRSLSIHGADTGGDAAVSLLADGGCNHVSVEGLTVDERAGTLSDGVRVVPVSASATAKACASVDLQRVDNAVVSVFTATPTVQVDGDHLTISTDTMRLEYQRG